MNTNICRTTAPPPNRLDPVQRLWIGLAIVSAVAVAIGSVGPCVHCKDYSEEVPRPWTDCGLISSGVFSLMFAVGAFVTLVLAALGRDSTGLVWIAFGLLTLCAITGLFEWITVVNIPASANPTWIVGQAGWGMITVGVAGLVGAASSFLAARALNRF